MKIVDQIENKNIDIKLETNISESITFNLIGELKFDALSLQDNIISHTESVAYITFVLEHHKEFCDLIEQDIRVKEAIKWTQYKTDTGSDNKALSDVRVTYLVNTDIELNELKRQLTIKKSYVRLLEQVIKLFNTKKELMQTFSSNARMNI